MKHRHLSLSLHAYHAFATHAVRLACGCSFPFPGKGKEFSYYKQVLISSDSYKVLSSLTLGSTKCGGIIYQRKILTGRLSISVAARKLGENRIVHMRDIKMTSEVSCGKRVEISNVLNVIS